MSYRVPPPPATQAGERKQFPHAVSPQQSQARVPGHRGPLSGSLFRFCFDIGKVKSKVTPALLWVATLQKWR